MYLENNEVLFGDTIIRVEKEPMTLYTGYSEWIRKFKVLNASKEEIISFTMNDVDSQVLSTGLYMYYSDCCFNPEFNYEFDPNYGGDILLDFDLLEVINPLVCSKYDIQLLLEMYNGWGMINIPIPSTSPNLDSFTVVLEGHNVNLSISIYHIDKFGKVIERYNMDTENMEDIYNLSQTVNDDLDSLVTNFIQNNL